MKRITTLMALLAMSVLGMAGVAQARHGADDPPGDDRGGALVEPGDDNGGDRPAGVSDDVAGDDKGGERKHHGRGRDDGKRRARRGADDRGGHRHRHRHRGRGAHHGPNHT
jgi:hypothetical protein